MTARGYPTILVPAQRLRRTTIEQRTVAQQARPHVPQRQPASGSRHWPASTSSRPACGTSGSATTSTTATPSPPSRSTGMPRLQRSTAAWSAGTYGYYSVTRNDSARRQRPLEQLGVLAAGQLDRQQQLTINAGVRGRIRADPVLHDGQEAMGIKFGFGDKIAPRLGFAYDLKGDGKWKAYGSFGLYYDITSCSCPAARGAATTGSTTTDARHLRLDEHQLRRGPNRLPGHAASRTWTRASAPTSRTTPRPSA